MKIQSKFLFIFVTITAFGSFLQAKHHVTYNSDIFLDIQYKDYSAISRWFKSKPDFNVVDVHGQTVLMKAVQSGNKSLVSKLLKKGINVNLIDDSGKTALDYAAELKHKKIALNLVKKKAMVTTQENLVIIKQFVTSRSRFLKAIGNIFKGIAYMFLIPTMAILGYMIIYGSGAGGIIILPIFAIAGTGYTAFFSLLSIPFFSAATAWNDRKDWYNPNLLVVKA